jgi:hypothetical protein
LITIIIFGDACIYETPLQAVISNFPAIAPSEVQTFSSAPLLKYP